MAALARIMPKSASPLSIRALANEDAPPIEAESIVYAGQWFHGISQLRLPARAEIELELVLTYGHWGGVAAVSSRLG